MKTRIEKMDSCMNPQTSAEELIALLQDTDWQIVMAAVVALGDRKEAKAFPALVALLDKEDAAPLFSQKEDYTLKPAGTSADGRKRWWLPEDTTHETAMAWDRRGRLKQSAMFALAAIGLNSEALSQKLQVYAVDQSQDHPVRMAACRTLGFLKDASACSTLEKASTDDEWCTLTEAKKALARLN